MAITLLAWMLIALGIFIVAAAYLANFTGAPGSPFILLGIVLIAWATAFEIIGVWSILLLALLALIAEGFDVFGGLLGAYAAGSEKGGIWGGAVGMVVGIILSLWTLNPLPVLICVVLGVFIGEYMEKKEWKPALKGSVAVIVGKVGGIMLKQVICTGMILYTAGLVIYKLFFGP